jgi:peptidoglycan-N-acetylglucosamine deacetylase
LAKSRGSIILVHPMYKANETGRLALPLILDGLKARGLAVVTVGELLEAGAEGER